MLFLFLLLNISLGSVHIPISKIISILMNFGEPSKSSWDIIVIDYRLPKAITAIMVGSGLSISGLLMQTLFRNPLAGPFVLGISSGASLGVALFILGSALFGSFWEAFIVSNWSITIAASIGAFFVLSLIIIAANKVRNTMSILIIGLMFGSLTSSVINVLSYLSEANKIQQYQYWSLGSLGNLTWSEILVFFIFYLISIVGTTLTIKPLNSLLLGENYAKSLGLNVELYRNIILLITSLMTGVITAFSGPIGFIGIATPHLAKIYFVSSNHKILIPASAILGAILLLICDCIAQIPNSSFTLPINAITSLFGAPVVIWLLIRKKKVYV